METPTVTGPELRPTQINGEQVPPLRTEAAPAASRPQFEYFVHVFPKWAEITALLLAAIYRLGVAGGAIALAWSLRSPWALFAALPLLFLSPKTKN
jgi:hypothetical protein